MNGRNKITPVDKIIKLIRFVEEIFNNPKICVSVFDDYEDGSAKIVFEIVSENKVSELDQLEEKLFLEIEKKFPMDRVRQYVTIRCA